MPMFSIVLPCHNAAADLPATLAALQGQLEDNWELICINDGSTDGTLAMLMQAARDDHRIRVVHQMATGQDAAFQAGHAAAHGQYVLFLDPGTTWAPQHLTQVRAQFAALPQAAALQSDTAGLVGMVLRRDVMFSMDGFLVPANGSFTQTVRSQVAAAGPVLALGQQRPVAAPTVQAIAA